MIDREKVINGLELLAHWPDGLIITDQEKWIKPCCETAVSMLKEQEAVEPTLIREGRNKNYNDYVCPRCDNEVVYEQNYCSECGVQFLWEGR